MSEKTSKTPIEKNVVKTDKTDLTNKGLADAGFTLVPEPVPESVPEKVPEETEASEPVEEPVKVKKKLGSNMVNVKVLVGTLKFEDGTFQKGQTFQAKRSCAEKFDKKDVEISEVE